MGDVQRRRRPLIVGMVALIFSVQAILLPILFVAFLLLPSTATMMYNGAEVAVGEKRLEVIGAMLLTFAFVAYVGPGLWRGRPTARSVAFGVYAGLPTILLVMERAWTTLPWLVACCAIVGYYLYLKPNVRDFFSDFSGV